MRTKEFEAFFDRTSRIIERAIDSDFAILKDYFAEDGEDESQAVSRGDKIHHQFTFMENEFLRRAISSIDWSPKVPELLLCSYSKSGEWKHNDADGLINIFSLAMRSRPELQLTSQYEITKAMFNPFKPNEVLAATFSGNILQWDTRAKTVPVQKSCMAKNGHKHPIYSLAVVGSANAHNIVSVSNDGKLCFWSPDNLSEPKIHQQLVLPQTGA